MGVRGGGKLRKKIFLFILVILLLNSYTIQFDIVFGKKDNLNSTIFYDFVQNADKATWKNSKTTFPFFGTRPGDISNNPVDSRGFASWRTNVTLEDNKTYLKVLETHPEWVDNGEISGTYPILTVPSNAKLIIKFGFMKGATNSDGVVAKIFFDDKKTLIPLWSSDYKSYNGTLKTANIDISNISGKIGNFILYVHTYKSSTQDWACWVDAKIEYEETKPDLTISDIRVSGNRVYYKLKNIGNASLFYTTPIPFINILYLNGVKVFEENININLNPNEEHETYFKNYNFVEPNTNYKLKVCGDTNNYINESNETNNCLEKSFTPSLGGIKVDTGCPNVLIEIFDDEGVLVKSGYSDSSNIYSTGLTLIPGNYKVVPNKEGFTFDTKEKNVNVVANQLSEVYFICNKIKKPDLIVESLVCDFEKKIINFIIVNIGEEKVSLPFEIALFIDGVLKDSVTIEKTLNPKERNLSSFVKYLLQCTNIKVKVIVDYSKKIDEENEENNFLEKDCKCEQKDETNPKIVEEPSVINITQNFAEVIWKTDEESDSGVFYDSKSNSFIKSSFNKNYVINHKIKLTNLKPGTVYEFYVESKDRSGNSVKSKSKYFKTLEEEDKEKPIIDLRVPQNIVGITRIIADVRDNKRIDRVVFYIDNIEAFTDYSLPFEFQLDSVNITNGIHSFSARAFDSSGNNNIALRDGNIINNLFSPIIKIVEPLEGSTIEGETNIRVNISCPQMGCTEGSGVNKLEYYINSNLVYTEVYSREICTGVGSRRHCFTTPTASLPLVHQFIYNFTQANRENEIQTEIKVVAYYSTGNNSSDSIIVNKKFVKIEGINITREVNRVNNYYEINLKITNTGNINYEKDYIKLIDYHCGFEVGRDIKFIKSNGSLDDGWQYNFEDSSYLRAVQSRINSNEPTLTMTFEKSNFLLRPLEYIIINYKLVPVLYDQPIDFQHIIGCKSLECWFGFSSNNVCLTPYRYDLYINKENEFNNLTNNSDYLIITNPFNLRINTLYDKHKEYNKLLFTMAQLAIEKNGILGFVISSRTSSANDYRHVFRNWGNYYLKSDWNNNGYLLIVGETEIVPTFTVSCWDGNYDSQDDTIHWTDSPYASTSGEDIHPEIFIGRIVGDDVLHLIIPIETSLKVKKGEKEFCRNNSPCASSIAISGVKSKEDFLGCQSTFTCTIRDLADNDKGDLGSEFQVYFLQGSSYHDDENKKADDKRREAFLENVNGRDVIVYFGHGYCAESNDYDRGLSGVIKTTDIGTYGIDFGNTAPFCFTAACCTGRYERLYGFPEALFSYGLGVYIGSTEISYEGCYCCCPYTNEEELHKFFDAWLNHPNRTIAEAWRERRQDIAYEKCFENSRYWSTEYQFYGDPKFDKR